MRSESACMYVMVCIVSISAISDIHRRVTITAYRTIDSEHVYGRDFQDHCRESHGDFHVECVWLCREIYIAAEQYATIWAKYHEWK